MSGEIVREWNFWIVSMITGGCMAFAYDVLRLFRRLVRHGRFAVDIEDILYWTICFLLSFTLLYYGNNGVIRFAAVFGAAIGMLLYAVTVGRFFVKVSYWLIDKTVGSLIRLILKIAHKIRQMLSPIKRLFIRGYHRWIKFGLFQKIRLTRNAIAHRMKLKNNRRKKGKGGYALWQEEKEAEENPKEERYQSFSGQRMRIG